MFRPPFLHGKGGFFCSGYRKNTDLCSAHYIRERVAEQLVLKGLQRLLRYVQVYEKRFAQERMERFGLQEKKELTARRRELDRARERVAEIDQLIQKSYEDMSKGLLSEERVATLTVSLENEQRQLKADIPEMESSLAATADKAADLQRFIERARQVTRLTKLTPEIVHEFIEKIVMSKSNFGQLPYGSCSKAGLLVLGVSSIQFPEMSVQKPVKTACRGPGRFHSQAGETVVLLPEDGYADALLFGFGSRRNVYFHAIISKKYTTDILQTVGVSGVLDEAYLILMTSQFNTVSYWLP